MNAQLLRITHVLSFTLHLCVLGAPLQKYGSTSRPLTTRSHSSIDDAVQFMKRYGYLEKGIMNSDALHTEDAVVQAIKTMQKFGAIPQTGILDNSTQQLMKRKRCGVPDVIRTKRIKRYIIGAEGWKKRNITYFVANWTPKLGEENVVKIIQEAFNSWSGYARLNFKIRPDPNADIIIAFGRGPHGDNYPFDGPGNILAHAYFPYEDGSYGGDIHFDDDEEWTINPGELDSGVDFFTVAVHELGHSLGLAHSPVPGSIMFPYYKGYQPSFQLDYDDILAVYELYVSQHLPGDTLNDESKTENEQASHNDTSNDSHDGEEESTDPNSDSTSNDVEERDEESQISSSTSKTEITYEGDVETVDEHLNHDSRNNGTTNKSTLPSLCKGKIDAISLLRNELFVFKGNYIWRLRSRQEVLSGYPVPLHQFFDGLPQSITNVDSVYQRDTDQNIILFTGSVYWIYDGDKFIENSPKPITSFGFPHSLQNIDAAFIWGKNGKTFLFSGSEYWRFNETTKVMDPGYPHNISRWRGIPTQIDAAFTWKDGQTYFFKDNLFWRFNNHIIKTDEHFPQPLSWYWFNCAF